MRCDKPPLQPERSGRREGNGQNAKDILLPSDNTAATFWITNPDNTYRDNVAAGSDSNGFWMSPLPEHPNGKFADTELSAKTWPRRTPFREFKGNVSPLQLRLVHVRPEHCGQQHFQCYRQLAYRP